MSPDERKKIERTIKQRDRINRSPLALGIQAILEHHHGLKLEYNIAPAHVAFMLAIGEFFIDSMTEEARDYLAVLLENQEAILDRPETLMSLFCNTVSGEAARLKQERENKWTKEQYERKNRIYTAANDPTGRR